MFPSARGSLATSAFKQLAARLGATLCNVCEVYSDRLGVASGTETACPAIRSCRFPGLQCGLRWDLGFVGKVTQLGSLPQGCRHLAKDKEGLDN